MTTHDRPGLVAEVHCLNCSRVLAQAVRRSEGGGVELRPADHTQTVQAIVAPEGGLRCERCGGHAYIDVFRQPVERRGALRAWPA